MNISLNGKVYQMTTVQRIENELFVYLKDEENHMYKMGISDIILHLYKNKAMMNLKKYHTVEELKNDLLYVDRYLSDIEEYRYLKKLVPQITVNQEKLNKLFGEIIKVFLQVKKNEEKISSLENNTTTMDPKEDYKQKYHGMSDNELLFQLQMHPGSLENEFIREELERRSNVKENEQKTYYSPNNQEKLKVLRLEQQAQLRGFVLNTLLAFLVGVVVGVWGLVLINIVIRL